MPLFPGVRPQIPKFHGGWALRRALVGLSTGSCMEANLTINYSKKKNPSKLTSFTATTQIHSVQFWGPKCKTRVWWEPASSFWGCWEPSALIGGQPRPRPHRQCLGLSCLRLRFPLLCPLAYLTLLPPPKGPCDCAGHTHKIQDGLLVQRHLT